MEKIDAGSTCTLILLAMFLIAGIYAPTWVAIFFGVVAVLAIIGGALKAYDEEEKKQ